MTVQCTGSDSWVEVWFWSQVRRHDTDNWVWLQSQVCRDESCRQGNLLQMTTRIFGSLTSSLYDMVQIFARTDGCCGGRFHRRLCVSFSARYLKKRRITKVDMELFHMSRGNLFILGHKVKRQGHKAHKTASAWKFALLWVLSFSSLPTTNFSFFCLIILLLDR